MRSGAVPASKRRSTRLVKTWVLPVPALALAQCRRRAGQVTRRSPGNASRCLLVALDRPFGNAGQMREVIEVIPEAWPAQGPIGRLEAIEVRDQAGQAGTRRLRQAGDLGGREI